MYHYFGPIDASVDLRCRQTEYGFPCMGVTKLQCTGLWSFGQLFDTILPEAATTSLMNGAIT
jgi:hypothetical protein